MSDTPISSSAMKVKAIMHTHLLRSYLNGWPISGQLSTKYGRCPREREKGSSTPSSWPFLQNNPIQANPRSNNQATFRDLVYWLCWPLRCYSARKGGVRMGGCAYSRGCSDVGKIFKQRDNRARPVRSFRLDDEGKQASTSLPVAVTVHVVVILAQA